jgi:DNA-binding transcriptional regulator YiaG
MKQKKDFAARLLAWRKAKNLSRNAAAAALRINKDTLQSWEQRRRSPLLSTAENILARIVLDGH